MKKWYTSKTVIVNGLTLVGGIVSIIAASDLIKENTQAVLVLTTLVLPIINLFLRWLTSQPITSWFKELDALRPSIKGSKH